MFCNLSQSPVVSGNSVYFFLITCPKNRQYTRKYCLKHAIFDWHGNCKTFTKPPWVSRKAIISKRYSLQVYIARVRLESLNPKTYWEYGFRLLFFHFLKLNSLNLYKIPLPSSPNPYIMQSSKHTPCAVRVSSCRSECFCLGVSCRSRSLY